jgi:hypothetical protein
MEYPRHHIGCKGVLNFAETKREVVVVNKKAVDKYGAKAIIKQFNKDFYKCTKCNVFINVIIMPSWEEYVLMGKIRIDKQAYWRLKEETRARQERRFLHDK